MANNNVNTQHVRCTQHQEDTSYD